MKKSEKPGEWLDGLSAGSEEDQYSGQETDRSSLNYGGYR